MNKHAPTAGTDLIAVEVAYALPDAQLMLAVDVPPETTVEAAVQASGILQRHPEIDLGRNKAGIFGKLCTLDAGLRAGDRIEIYRPLIADPKEVRRKRAKSD